MVLGADLTRARGPTPCILMAVAGDCFSFLHRMAIHCDTPPLHPLPRHFIKFRGYSRARIPESPPGRRSVRCARCVRRGAVRVARPWPLTGDTVKRNTDRSLAAAVAVSSRLLFHVVGDFGTGWAPCHWEAFLCMARPHPHGTSCTDRRCVVPSSSRSSTAQRGPREHEARTGTLGRASSSLRASSVHQNDKRKKKLKFDTCLNAALVSNAGLRRANGVFFIARCQPAPPPFSRRTAAQPHMSAWGFRPLPAKPKAGGAGCENSEFPGGAKRGGGGVCRSQGLASGSGGGDATDSQARPSPSPSPLFPPFFPAAPAGACPAASRGPHPLAPLAAPAGVVSHN